MVADATREDEWLLLLHGAALGLRGRDRATWRSSAERN